MARAVIVGTRQWSRGAVSSCSSCIPAGAKTGVSQAHAELWISDASASVAELLLWTVSALIYAFGARCGVKVRVKGEGRK